MQRDEIIEVSSKSYHLETGRTEPPLIFPPTPDDGVPARFYLRLIWNRRWIILAIILATLIVITIRTVKQKPVYKALGTLQIEMPTKAVQNFEDLYPSTDVPDAYLQTQSKILSSGQLTGKVMDELHMSSQVEHGQPASRWSQQRTFQERLNVQVVRGSQLIQVSFESENPALAAQVVNQLMSIYIDQIKEERSETASGASSWVLAQLKESKVKLDESIDSLRRYEQAHQLFALNPDRERLMNTDSDRLQQLQKELASVEGTRIERKASFSRVQAGDTGMVRSEFLDENLKKETELQAKLAQLQIKFGPNFPQVQSTQTELTAVRKTLAREKERLAKELEAVYQGSLEQEAILRGKVEEQRLAVSRGSDQMIQDNILKREVDFNQRAYEGLLQKFQEASTSERLTSVSARIVDPAEPPVVSSYPGLVRNLWIGLLIALILGVGIAFAEEFLRETIKTPAELELDLNLPVLGVIPAGIREMSHRKSNGNGNGFHLPGRGRRATDKIKSGDWFRLDRAGSIRSEFSESIRNLRTSLMFALEGKGSQAILFSSSGQSDGKTTISSNISISLTQLGKTVLMIDGDLRRPCLHKVFSLSARPGLSEYLQEACAWEDIVQSSNIPGLDIVVCGERPLNPAELLSSPRMRRIIEQAKRKYDLVVVDSPTLLNMADSRILASYVDSVVLIVRSRATPKQLAKLACANVRSANATIIGAVLNQLEVGDSAYSYSYHEESLT